MCLSLLLLPHYLPNSQVRCKFRDHWRTENGAQSTEIIGESLNHVAHRQDNQKREEPVELRLLQRAAVVIEIQMGSKH